MPRLKALDKRHGQLFKTFLPKPRPLPGAVELLRFLRRNKIVHGIATSNHRPNINSSLEDLGVTEDTVVVERGDVARAKPEPDLFLECSERLGVEVKDCYVVGDAVWDLMAARRAGMLSIGLLSGGYGEDELVRAGAFRAFRDAADLHGYLDELGVLP
jgi:HAD superfamily hydrolase (TIGR01509 family)